MYIIGSSYVHVHVGVIAMGWALHMKARMVKSQLKERQETHIVNYRTRLDKLGENWEIFHNHKRVLIHVPSKG